MHFLNIGASLEESVEILASALEYFTFNANIVLINLQGKGHFSIDTLRCLFLVYYCSFFILVHLWLLIRCEPFYFRLTPISCHQMILCMMVYLELEMHTTLLHILQYFLKQRCKASLKLPTLSTFTLRQPRYHILNKIQGLYRHSSSESTCLILCFLELGGVSRDCAVENFIIFTSEESLYWSCRNK